ncbi:hypothetical protein [Bacteroides sp.]|uniref:hypothetical protein n=1 Tax=Bacteroides sp. TaxID=29523 RepID=UPI002587CC0F|nr:hypothetical protein [Bacteroides sp.]
MENLIPLLSITFFGNLYLQGDKVYPEFDTINPAFRNFHTISFWQLDPDDYKKPPLLKALTPTDWFAFLKELGCKGVRLLCIYSTRDESQEAPILNKGRWMIETMFSDHSWWWYPKVDGAETAKSGTMRLVSNEDAPILNMGESHQSAKKKLKIALQKALDFSLDHANSFDGDIWARMFHSAIELLDDNHIYKTLQESNYNYNWLPMDELSTSAHQLVFAAYKANVFGGSSSWLDQEFESEEVDKEFRQVSNQLYTAMNNAYLAVANRAG